MLRKNGNLGEFSSTEGMLTVCAEEQCVNFKKEKAWIDKNTLKNKTLQTPFKSLKENNISNNGEEMKDKDDSNLNEIILYDPSENDNTRSMYKDHPVICVNSENIEDSCLPDNGTPERRPSFEISQPSNRVKRLSSLFSKSCDLKAALSISTKDLINHCRMKKKHCSYFTSELLNKRRKHHYKLPLSRSASWSEIDMIGDCEHFIEIEDIQQGHQPHIDKNTEVPNVLNNGEIR